MRNELREWIEELACRAGLDGLPRSVRPAALLVALSALGVALWWWGAPAQKVTPAAAGPRAAAAAPLGGAGATRPSALATVTVHVVGAVMRPAVYSLPGGSRVAQAVDAAGGLLGTADQSGINLARELTDGEQIVVPTVGQAPPPGGVSPPRTGSASAAGVTGAAPTGPVDLNTATAEQLDALPGVGPVTAAKIVSDRTENGPFRTADDLMRVPGIGAKRFESLKDLVTVR